MRVGGQPGGGVRGGEERELRDDTGVRVVGEGADDVGREAGAGGQLLPAGRTRVGGQAPCPLRPAGTLVEEGERGERPGGRVDVGGGEPARVRESHRGPLVVRGQGEHLGPAQVRPVRQVLRQIGADVGVRTRARDRNRNRNRNQPVHQVRRQSRVGGQAVEDVIHGRR